MSCWTSAISEVSTTAAIDRPKTIQMSWAEASGNIGSEKRMKP